MDELDRLAQRFEEQRPRLRAIAYRMLGASDDADDAVQETWLRLCRFGGDGVANLGGWLTTVLARVCLNLLRSRRSRGEVALDDDAYRACDTHGGHGVLVGGREPVEPEQEVLRADSVGLALLVVLDVLSPAERVTFVLHDLFGVPFDEIAPVVDRTPEAARKLASRARRRVHRFDGVPDADPHTQRTLVEAFLAASRDGDLDGLVAVLDPDAVLHADSTAVRIGGPRELRGAVAVAETFRGRAQDAKPALLGAAVGAVWAPGGKPRVALVFTVSSSGRIAAVDLVADRESLELLDPAVLDPR